MFTDGADVTVAVVVRSGGDYLPRHALVLRRQLHKYLRAPFRFVALTDLPLNDFPDIEWRPLRHNWPGWWSKMELFREFPRGCFYMDLDTVVISDITDIAMPKDGFWAVRDLAYRAPAEMLQSNVMAWSHDMRFVYDAFCTDPERYMTAFRQGGDQAFIQSCLGKRHPVTYFQDHFPDRFVSYKWGIMKGQATERASVICFHGKPRPWQVPPVADWFDFIRSQRVRKHSQD